MKAKKGVLALVLGTGLLTLFLVMAGVFTANVAPVSTLNETPDNVETLTLEAAEQPQTRIFPASWRQDRRQP
jgi:hypothetical protein